MLSQLAHLFIPRHTNNHHPRILHPAGLSLLIGIFLFSNATIKLYAASEIQLIQGVVLGYASNISADQVIQLTNAERAKLGLKPLSHNVALSSAAQSKASDMFTFNYWAHDNPNTGKKPWAFIKEAGYTYRYAGENLARDFGDTSTMVSAWMTSPSHRDNIVSDRYSQTGIAVVNGTLQGVETTLVVQMFGNPTSTQTVSTSTTLGQTQPVQDSVKTPPSPQPEEKTFAPITIIQASENNSNQSLISPLALSQTISMSILLLLSIALIIDFLIIKRRRTIRVSGQGIAHLAFLGVLIIIVLMSAPGGIL